MSKSVSQKIKDAKQSFCAMCGSDKDLQYHHVRRPIHGGENDPKNIIVLCADCHHGFIHEQRSWSHNESIREGIASAKERGVRVGRKPADHERVMRLIAENSTQFNPASIVTENEIMKMAGVKSVCYHKCKRMLLEAMNADVWPFNWSKPRMASYRPLYDRVIKKIRGDYTKKEVAIT